MFDSDITLDQTLLAVRITNFIFYLLNVRILRDISLSFFQSQFTYTFLVFGSSSQQFAGNLTHSSWQNMYN